MYLITYVDYRSGERKENIENGLFIDYRNASEYLLDKGYSPYSSKYEYLEFSLPHEDKHAIIREMTIYDR